MTKYQELFEALVRPFDAKDIKQVTKKGGRPLDYVTARVVMNRLDEVLGPENWWDEYTEFNRGVLCKVTIRLPDGSTLTKQDVGGYAGMGSDEDDVKSGPSDAFKRAAAKFGPGRHLYRDGIPDFAGGTTSPTASRSLGPDPRTQGPPQANGHPQAQDHAPRNGGGFRDGDLPKTGKALWAWAAKIREKGGPDLVRTINDIGKLNGWSKRMVDWDPGQVAEAVAKCQEIISTPPETMRLQTVEASRRSQAQSASAPGSSDNSGDDDMPF